MIVFDFDGVLVESNKIKSDWFVKIWDGSIESNLIKNVVDKTKSRQEIISKIYRDFYPDKLKIDYSIEYFLKKYSENVERDILLTGLKNGVYGFIKNSNKMLVINSATPNISLNTIVEKLGIKNFFLGVYGNDKSKVENFIKIQSEHGVCFDEMVFFGDMKSDMNAAKVLGIEFCPVYSVETDL